MNKAFTNFEWKNEPSYDTPLSAENLNSMNNALDTVDDRVITLDTTKLDKGTAYTMVQDVSFDESTGIFTITKLNGSKLTIDTKLEKLFINCEFDDERQQLVITLDDGTKQMVDVSALVTQYEFKESDTIILTADSDGKVYGKLKKGSITGDYLEPNYLANAKAASDTAVASAAEAKKSEANAKEAETNAVESAATASSNATIASTSATNAKESETNAKTSETNATNAATTATEKASEAVASASAAKTSETNSKASETNANTAAKTAQSYAVGGTGTREGEDTENAKHYYEAVKKVADYVVTGGVTGVKGSEESEFRTGQVTLSPADLGLGNVNNTSDADKPVSTAQQAAIESAVAAVETSRYGNIATAGWYRVAVISTPYADGGFPLNVDFIIRRTFNHGNNETHYLRFVMCYQKYQFVSLQSKSNWQIITKIRSTYDSDAECMYLEIYYAAENENKCLFTVSNKASVLAYWQAITPTITEETIDGVTVLATYDIPANATPVTDYDLKSVGLFSEALTSVWLGETHTMQELLALKTVTFFTNQKDFSFFSSHGSGILIPYLDSRSRFIFYMYADTAVTGGIRTDIYNVFSEDHSFNLDTLIIRKRTEANTTDLADYLPLSGGTVNALTSSTSLTAKGGLSGNTATPTPFYTKNRTYFVNKSLNWNTNSYLEHVILLLPTLTASNQGTDNYIDGKFLCWKGGANIFDTVEVNANICYNTLKYHLEYYGDHSHIGWKLCVCTYNGVSYYALKCPYHANPYFKVEFVGHIYAEPNGGTDTVALPLDVPYYNHHTSTVLNSEIYNSITDKLETTYVTQVVQFPKFFPAGIAGNANSADKATVADKLSTGRTIDVNLGSNIASSFDGSANMSTGCFGILPIAKGGTGATNAAQAIKNLFPTRFSTPLYVFTMGNNGYDGGGGWSTMEEFKTTLKVATKINTTIDLSNTSTYNADTYYPVVGSGMRYEGYNHIKVYVQLNSGTKPSWSTHDAGFTCNLDLLAIASGWGTTDGQTICLDSSYKFANANPVGYGQLGNSSTPVLYLRGGGRYYVTTDYDVGWSIKTSTYTSNSQSVSPTTTYPGIGFNKGTITANLSGTATTIGRNGDTSYPMTFLWSGQNGQPPWLWGGSDGTNMYVYNPSSFNVNSAKQLTTARTIQTNLGSTASASFNGTANVTPGVTGTLGIGNGGTGSTTVAGALSNLGTAPVVISTSAPSVTTALWAY